MVQSMNQKRAKIEPEDLIQRTNLSQHNLMIDAINDIDEKINKKNYPTVYVSPYGLDDGYNVPNGGFPFGPDTLGTTTNGIQEAIDSLKFVNGGILQGNVSISTEEASGCVTLLSGTFKLKASIFLHQGLTLKGQGRLSTHITIDDDVGVWAETMEALIVVPHNANNVVISNISISGNRSPPFQPFNIHGVLIYGYSWRPTLDTVEIVNCQGCGIKTDRYNIDDDNGNVYEPILINVSVISCNSHGILLTYCADELLNGVNVEACSGIGISYYGGNGKWVDTHVYDNLVGMVIGGQPLRVTSCSLDTNRLQGAIVEAIDSSISPGAVIFDSPLAQGNGLNGVGIEKCGIFIKGKNVVINNFISINKPNFEYQSYAIVEDDGADYTTIFNLMAVDMLIAPTILNGDHSIQMDLMGLNGRLEMMVQNDGGAMNGPLSATAFSSKPESGTPSAYYFYSTDGLKRGEIINWGGDITIRPYFTPGQYSDGALTVQAFDGGCYAKCGMRPSPEDDDLVTVSYLESRLSGL